MKATYSVVPFFLFLVAVFTGAGAFAQDPVFLIKPYVFSVKGKSIAVAWTYNSPQKGVTLTLHVGARVENVEPVLQEGLYTAVLPVPTCDFGELSYQVTGMEKVEHVNNVPCANTKETVRMSFLADTQEGYTIAGVFAQQIAQFNNNAVLHGGDFVQTGNKYSEWVSLFDNLAPAISGTVLLPAVGNHEYRYDKTVPFWKHFFQSDASEQWFATDVGPVHVIALNSCFEDDPSHRLSQLAWLKTELAKPARWKIVFFHHPAFSRGFLNSSMAPKKEWVILQKDYVPLFEEYKVDLVLNGHTHLFEHSLKDGIHYITVGPAGGKMGIFGGKNPYSLGAEKIRTIVELEANRSTLRAVSTTLEGKTIDELVLRKLDLEQFPPVNIPLAQNF